MLKLWRRPKQQTGPACDRCDRPTGHPSRYNMPRTPWRCDPCKEKATATLLRTAKMPDTYISSAASA